MSTTQPITPPPSSSLTPSGPSVEERWALLQRIAASEHFSRSARLRDFLLYVGKQSLRPNASEVHEQEIGTKVFGRSADYDRSQDNIVRVNATELRRRIGVYFETEGAHEPLQVEIPRGGYTPAFHYRAAANVPTVETQRSQKQERAQEPETVPSLSSTKKGAHGITRLIWPTICLALACAVVVLYQQNRAMEKVIEPWREKPAVAAFWKQFLDTGLQTDIVLPDDSFALYQDFTANSINLSDYTSRDFVRRIPTLPLSADRKADVTELLNHNLVTFGAIRAAQQIQAQIPSTYPRSMLLTRLYTADAIKRNNVVLIGGQKSNPWDRIFDTQQNFVVDYDYASKRSGFIRNRNPKANEQATYAIDGADSFATYAAISYLPNPSGIGHVLILAGLDSDGTAAAAEFLATEDSMARLKSLMHEKSYPYFEALLRVSRLNGTSLHAELVAFRAYQKLN